MDENLISINKLSFGYGKELLHKDINMQFNRGKVSAIMGEVVVVKQLSFGL